MKLYEPINTLKAVAENLWIVDGPIVRMAMYGTRIPFPTRMTIVRLNNGDLWCHSPIELSPELQPQIEALGTVKHLISPNKIHYAHIGAWSKVYPDAIAWASPGVRERAKQQKIEVEFQADLQDKPPPEWVTELDQLIFRGSRFMDEVVFFHRPSSTLILTDLIENFEPQKVPWYYRWMLAIGGNVDPDGKTPRDLQFTFWGNQEQARQCFQQMLAWNPQKVIVAHGRWYENNGTAELNRAFRWL
ncbi:DUF4336 domain-containing protein [Desertifilum sp. FACHB-1129]|uniref:DUF4336 domain-containing protein n=1 Tax=Desertifilum tharense IPPAS B-1220 TaxID=1781255 RepID=A0A1E5QLL2_9CYAN|nr:MULTISPECIES: DUF4336 domain-containing protein [Desertifilum]MDA0208739.1 DUF4336 domain-containing protein [Cyanobacteria bacterium FC1]MBD2310941.1 DUF4336 domain-containing protein [Desertifilum sp. FACHB-1129]MBD2321346.1 DUF4336 domain-containing protein [Desertifilum sp. FACHB-866]MBD2331347.1 DUF4336 domain-containing protein [Desertifilum sp. FACHB-868]OEJ75520.1 DUF4336 domain-containing protein [Desertifilum tharense IPPAS B-1220]